MNILDLLFPKYCLGCKKEGKYLCQRCVSEILTIPLVCPVCEKPSPFGETHPRCLNSYSPNGLISFFEYQGIIKEAIHKIKYKYVTETVGELIKIVLKEVEEEKEKKYIAFEKYVKEKRPVIVPIPLYWYKENTRGFNQAKLFADKLSLHYKLPLNDKILKRKKWTVSQTNLSEKDRQKNVKDIFVVKSNHQLPITNYLLVDDVWTTGSTLKEAANVLKRAGAEEVWGLTIAR